MKTFDENTSIYVFSDMSKIRLDNNQYKWYRMKLDDCMQESLLKYARETRRNFQI
jgi:hypothetical protein